MNNRKYPDFFPEHCPPVDALDHEVKVYRLIVGEEVDSTDFKSQHELGKLKRITSESPDFFKKFGLSVNMEFSELESVWRGNPFLKKRFKNIASGITYKDYGVIKCTPSKLQKNHHTWWLFEDANPDEYFEIE